MLTVSLPPSLQQALDATRGALDPASAARTPAHLGLFRHLPGLAAASLEADCRTMADGPAPLFSIGQPLMRGGALLLPVTSPGLDLLRAELAERWHGLLAPGDLARPRLHITLAGWRAVPQARTSAVPLTLFPLFGQQRAAGLLLWQHDDKPAHGEANWSALVAVGFRR